MRTMKPSSWRIAICRETSGSALKAQTGGLHISAMNAIFMLMVMAGGIMNGGGLPCTELINDLSQKD